eukprot:gnl/TRDRNA2_/TRDRNA2_138867_c0_seq4.p3 gnl/TRDRNA2_/TRDRNA2_138867_c0~~gnl/TRDRNA2_/TRDRNA2_138867_c0_seq4.p3  ORF type:complete len:165 (+),score=21.67 gnl/TRDRNA2_/TRDRNA2_138867_c0_seq4:758-1252(+)
MWNAATASCIFTCEGHKKAITAVAFSPDGRRIATGSLDGTAKSWDAQKADCRVTLQNQGLQGFVTSVAFSFDGKKLATGHSNGKAGIWLSSIGILARSLDSLEPRPKAVTSIAFSPNGCCLLTGSADYIARLWDIESRQILLTFKGHQHAITSVGFAACNPESS